MRVPSVRHSTPFGHEERPFVAHCGAHATLAGFDGNSLLSPEPRVSSMSEIGYHCERNSFCDKDKILLAVITALHLSCRRKNNILGVLRVFNPATCTVLMVAVCLPGFCVFSYLAGFAVSDEDGQCQNGNRTRLGLNFIQPVEGLMHLLLRRSDSVSSYTASASQSA
ncbi:hypothetical protein P692DRAFT_20176975, partial [Suillus brevipes Sb2]